MFNESKILKAFQQQNNSKVSFSDPIEIITNKFNEYFINVGPQLAKRIPKHDSITFEKYLRLNGKYRDSMFTEVERITENEVMTEIDNLSLNKSAGYDEFNAKIIKTIKQKISKPLAHIFSI
jgi:hypothetical protein